MPFSFASSPLSESLEQASDDQIILVNLLFMFLWLLQERKLIRKTICCWNSPSNPSILGFKLVNWQSFCDWSTTRLILWEKQTKFQARARLLFDSYMSWHDFTAGISFIEERDICKYATRKYEEGKVMKLPADEINDDVIRCAINFVNCDPWLEVPLFLWILNQKLK